eukprot:scaffold7_cov378-Prasinococcus_capsulatus_cf.AAC.3
MTRATDTTSTACVVVSSCIASRSADRIAPSQRAVKTLLHRVLPQALTTFWRLRVFQGHKVMRCGKIAAAKLLPHNLARYLRDTERREEQSACANKTPAQCPESVCASGTAPAQAKGGATCLLLRFGMCSHDPL